MRDRVELKKYYSSRAFLKNFVYDGNDLGVECNEDKTIFRLWSPEAEGIILNLYHAGNGEKAYRQIPMEAREKGVWSWETDEELHGVYYDYLITRDGEKVLTADPYAKACGVNGLRSMAVNLKKTDPEGWEKDQSPEEGEERIVYELHVKEFSWDKSGGFPEEYRGKYKAFTCKHTTLNNDGIHPTGLDYLKELGVTHIQIMPMYDYGSVDEDGDGTEFNWGYDPVNYNVPEGSYATDAKHGEVQKTLPWYFYRVFPDGTISNGSACGNDVASERAMCGKYILDSVLYWAKEYHIDGFRFDLMGLLDVDLMNRIRKELDLQYGKGKKIIYGEPWAATKTAVEGRKKLAKKNNIGLLDENVGAFCDSTRDGIKGSALKPKKAGFINGAQKKEDEMLASVMAWCANPYQARGWKNVKAPSQIVTYVSAHDNHTLWDKLKETVPEEECMRLNKMAAAVYMTCQGTLFFLSGEEFARTKDGLDNTFNASISLNCLKWEQAWQNHELVHYYQGLIALRKKISGLCDKSEDSDKKITDIWKEKQIVGFTVNNDEGCLWSQVKVIYNASKKAFLCDLDGNWELLCDGNDSWCFEKEIHVDGQVEVSAQSVVILGRK